MIDLTPLDVRNKRGDFKRILRGYDPQEVDVFLELVADRLEDLVREVMHLRERSDALQQQVSSQSGREQAVQEALVSAQELRKEIRGQAEREADLVIKEVEVEARRQRAEAEAEIRRMLRDAERKLEQAQDGLEEMERRRLRFLKAYRQLLEREMDVVQVEEERKPLEERPIELDLLGGRTFETIAGPAGPAGAAAAASPSRPSTPDPEGRSRSEAAEPSPPEAPSAPAAPSASPIHTPAGEGAVPSEPAASEPVASEAAPSESVPSEAIPSGPAPHEAAPQGPAPSEAASRDLPAYPATPTEEGVDALPAERRPPLDMAVDELAALYEGLEEPLDALAARYGILGGSEAPGAPEGAPGGTEEGEGPQTASADEAAPPGNGSDSERGQEPPKPEEPDFFNPPRHEGPDDPRWG